MEPFQLNVAGTSEAIAIRSFRDFYAFEQHVKTCRQKRGLEMIPQWYDFPVFYFSNVAGLVGNRVPIRVPAGCQELDFELELGLVIGKAGSDILPAHAWDHVLGFTIVNDFSARDLQRAEMAVGLGPAKGKDFATGVGPQIVPLSQVLDRIDQHQRLDLAMTAKLNGTVISRGNAKDMYFTWPQMIAHASANTTLLPGDLLGSGTVGTGCILELGPETTGGWLKPGDAIELEIEMIGTLSHPVAEFS